jgi:AcrR family transcriptional regulator
VLEAALHVIGKHGIDASTELISARAGVGIATVFRHYPTKQALLEAVLERVVEQLADALEDLAGSADAGAAFCDAMRQMIERAQTKKTVADALAGGGVEIRNRVWSTRMRDALSHLLEGAQRAGKVRTDIGVDVVISVLVAAARAIEHAGANSDLRARTVQVLLDGLRAPQASSAGTRSRPK